MVGKIKFFKLAVSFWDVAQPGSALRSGRRGRPDLYRDHPDFARLSFSEGGLFYLLYLNL
jgi:hypothetical protein